MATKGYYQDPGTKSCFELCMACTRCQARDLSTTKCRLCSGRNDPEGTVDPHPEEYCDCTRGVLRWRKANGEVILVNYLADPFSGRVVKPKTLEEEKDWNNYVQQQREKLNDEHWDPIRFTTKG